MVTTGSKTYGQLLNHSSLHANAVTKIYATGKKSKLDVLFVAKHDIRVDEEIVWDYGKKLHRYKSMFDIMFHM